MDDIRLTFDRVPELYDTVRPGYPAAFFELLADRLSANPAVLEVGPGTGQATASLVAHGASVTAVELGSNLAAKLAEKYEGSDQVRVVNDDFEKVTLDPQYFAAVVSATAYHWIAPEARLQRPHELLTPDGWLAVIDLIQVGSTTDGGYFDRVQPIYHSFGDRSHDWQPPTYTSAMPPIAEELEESELFDDPEVHRIRWDQTYTSSQYRDLLLTYSGTQMMPEGERTDLVDQLIAVVEEDFDGSITRPLVATLTMARMRSGTIHSTFS